MTSLRAKGDGCQVMSPQWHTQCPTFRLETCKLTRNLLIYLPLRNRQSSRGRPAEGEVAGILQRLQHSDCRTSNGRMIDVWVAVIQPQSPGSVKYFHNLRVWLLDGVWTGYLDLLHSYTQLIITSNTALRLISALYSSLLRTLVFSVCVH
jgi:hypothetical protein